MSVHAPVQFPPSSAGVARVSLSGILSWAGLVAGEQKGGAKVIANDFHAKKKVIKMRFVCVILITHNPHFYFNFHYN